MSTLLYISVFFSPEKKDRVALSIAFINNVCIGIQKL